MRTLALFLNFFIPGTGSLVLGKWRTGLAQLVILAASLLAFAYSFHSAYAVGAIAADWIWGLIAAEWHPHTGAVKPRAKG